MQPINKILGIILICALSLQLASCKKYLSGYSQNMSFVETAQDLNELLIGDAYLDWNNEAQTTMFHIMDDDIEMGIPNTSTIYTFDHGLAYWQAEPRMNSRGDIENSDNYYNSLYAKIARINTILLESDKLRSNGEPANELDRINGEAHFLRAYYYYLLVNLYGKPYKQSTAHVDYGVPLKTTPDIVGQFVSRSTVKDVYTQILLDLEKSVAFLSNKPWKSLLRVSTAASYGLLSRVHLYMENYDLSIEYANRVIAMERFKLANLNQFSTGQVFLNKSSSEVMLSMGGNYLGNWMSINLDKPNQIHVLVSNNLYQSYKVQDLRRLFFFSINTSGNARIIKKGKGVNANIDDVSERYTIRLSEMYLNKAEALAVLGRSEEARTTIYELYKNRFQQQDIPVLNIDGAALVQEIREERRRELCLEGLRWFDLRRYGVNKLYPYGKKITHRSIVATGTGYIENGFYELGTYAEDEAAYTIPIANDEIEFNQGRIVNEIRPDRPLKR